MQSADPICFPFTRPIATCRPAFLSLAPLATRAARSCTSCWSRRVTTTSRFCLEARPPPRLIKKRVATCSSVTLRRLRCCSMALGVPTLCSALPVPTTSAPCGRWWKRSSPKVRFRGGALLRGAGNRECSGHGQHVLFKTCGAWHYEGLLLLRRDPLAMKAPLTEENSLSGAWYCKPPFPPRKCASLCRQGRHLHSHLWHERARR